MQSIVDNILELSGNTPIVKLNRLVPATGAHLYAKLEYMNPGSSIKDRVAIQMVLDAEDAGLIKPGGTLVECTSGNTGMGLAIVGSVRGYRVVLVMPDKVSDEKIKALRAFGARVITTPTAVAPEDPRSYYSVARRIAEETSNSFFTNQYQNQSNPAAHEKTTGPEIWDQMGSSLDAVVIASGTGGTITGVGRFLKRRVPAIKMICVDPEGSIFYDYWRTGKIPKAHTYMVEGFGEDFIPATIDFSFVDEVVQVSDKECFLAARDLTRKEGLFTGGSGGGAVAGAIKWADANPAARTILVILPDSGSRYLSKVYDDEWLKANSFLEDPTPAGSVADLLRGRSKPLISARPSTLVQEIIGLMEKHGISQVPLLEGTAMVGMITEGRVLSAILEDPTVVGRPAEELAMAEGVAVTPGTPIADLSRIFSEGKVAVVRQGDRVADVITTIDLVDYLARASHQPPD
jgi:cystathionine beta-synthase